jgi:hypothetical protein
MNGTVLFFGYVQTVNFLTNCFNVLLDFCIFPLKVCLNDSLCLFLLRYERDFFLDVVNGNGIISWGAVDTSRSDELVGFVTTKMVSAQDSEVQQVPKTKQKKLILLTCS